MSSKIICFVTSKTLKYCYKVVFLFESFLVITALFDHDEINITEVSTTVIPINDGSLSLWGCN